MTSIVTTSIVSNAMCIVLLSSEIIKESYSILRSKDNHRIYPTRLYDTLHIALGDNPVTSCGFWTLSSLEYHHEEGDCLVTHIFALNSTSKSSVDCSFNIIFVGSILDGIIEMQEVYPVECIEGVWVPIEEFKWMG